MLRDDSLVEMVEAPDSAMIDLDGDISMLADDNDNTAESEVNVTQGSRRGNKTFSRGSRRVTLRRLEGT